MNQALHFRFAVLCQKDEVAEHKRRRALTKIALVCLVLWLFCIVLRFPDWTSTFFSQGMILCLVVGLIDSTISKRKERARWGGIDLDARELIVNILDGPKQKIPLRCVRNWKIKHKFLIINWEKPDKTWLRGRKISVPFQELEQPNEFLSEFENRVAATKNSPHL